MSINLCLSLHTRMDRIDRTPPSRSTRLKLANAYNRLKAPQTIMTCTHSPDRSRPTAFSSPWTSRSRNLRISKQLSQASTCMTIGRLRISNIHRRDPLALNPTQQTKLIFPSTTTIHSSPSVECSRRASLIPKLTLRSCTASTMQCTRGRCLNILHVSYRHRSTYQQRNNLLGRLYLLCFCPPIIHLQHRLNLIH